MKLPELAAVLWRAYGEGQVTEAEAESLSALIELKRIPPEKPVAAPRRPVGSRPRSDASMERRRRWAASGRLPPAIAAQFTLAEQAVLSVVTVETVKRGDCRLTHDHIAALAGVSRSTVKATLRRARDLGLVTIEERRSTAWRNLPNIARVVSREWQAWMRLVRREPTGGGGVKSSATTDTRGLRRGRQVASVTHHPDVPKAGSKATFAIHRKINHRFN
ncbi:transcriptional regulator [Methylorubrum sp. POS3]|uniref:transcriptional regulator n=1 Tax=Methylorubrum sp. POS3 TaxID=2998492 RepID=UPI00372CEC8F